MPVNIDLRDAKDPFAAIDDGTYTLECVDAELGKSKAGDMMAKFTFQVIGDSDVAGHQLFENAVLEGKGGKFGIWRLTKLCNACDVPLGPVEEIDWEAFKGRTFDALIEKTPPQGEYGEGNRIKEVLV